MDCVCADVAPAEYTTLIPWEDDASTATGSGRTAPESLQYASAFVDLR